MMLKTFSRPLPLLALLAFCTFVPVMMAGVRVVQLPLGALPDDSLRMAVAPVSLFVHALGGVLFGILGPVQFVGALRRRHGRWHRLAGRAYVAAGLAMGLGGLGLLAQVASPATPLLDGFRGLAGAALVVALLLGLRAARARQFARHGAWMVRAYAIGMGAGSIALVMFPIYLITGQALTGWLSDAVFVGWWGLNIGLAEWVVRRAILPRPQAQAAAPSRNTAMTLHTGATQ